MYVRPSFLGAIHSVNTERGLRFSPGPPHPFFLPLSKPKILKEKVFAAIADAIDSDLYVNNDVNTDRKEEHPTLQGIKLQCIVLAKVGVRLIYLVIG